MLTNEQCIEIAEKVWGWKIFTPKIPDNIKTDDGESRYVGPLRVSKHGKDYVDEVFAHPNHMANEINSWQGFGRTVEAMIGNTKIDLLNGFPIRCLNRQQITKEQFWKRTHLAALEALK